MTIEKRIATCQLLERMNKNKNFCKTIGLYDATRQNKKELRNGKNSKN